MKSQRIFITGATGLLGSYIVRLLLREGYNNIVALKRPTSRVDLLGGASQEIQWFDGDIRDTTSIEDAIAGAKWVIHAAALVSYARKDWQKMEGTNIEGTANVVNAALSAGVERLLHISSIAAFTRTGKQQHSDESTPWEKTRYTSHYGYTKYLAEMEAWRGRGEGLDLSVLNPSVILGGGDWDQGSGLIFKRLSRGLRFYPTGSTGYVDARDVARLALICLEQNISGERIIANGFNMSYPELFRRIANLMNTEPPSFAVQPWMGEIGWRLATPLRIFSSGQPTLSKQVVRTTTCKLSFDNTRSLSIPGFSYHDPDETLKDVSTLCLQAKSNGFQAAVLVI